MANEDFFFVNARRDTSRLLVDGSKLSREINPCRGPSKLRNSNTLNGRYELANVPSIDTHAQRERERVSTKRI